MDIEFENTPPTSPLTVNIENSTSIDLPDVDKKEPPFSLNSKNLATMNPVLPLPKNVKPFFPPTPPRSPTPPSAQSDHSLDHWSSDVEHVLDNVRANSEILSTHHKQSYLKLQAQLVYFRVPLIILSALNSVFSVGLSIYIEQQTVSSVNCLISLICACISSVELFLQIQKKLEVELSSYHGYYLLGTRISATLKLERAHREVEGLTFLNNMLSEYNNLFEQSCVDKLDIDDKLVAIDTKHFKH